MIVNKYNTGGGGSGSGYTLPIASASRLGGIKVGDGLAINPSTGVLSTSGNSEGGDSHILLASSAAPAGIQDGDVFASLIPAHDTDYDVSWTDTGSNSWQGARDNYSKDIKIVTTGDCSVYIQICNSPWGTGLQQFNISNGTIACENPDAGWINVTSTRCQFTGWTEAGFGDKIFVDLVDGAVYAYSADRSQIWVYEAQADTDIYIGEIIYPEEAKYAIFQAASGSSALTFVEYAKKDEIPASNRLLPESANDNNTLIYSSGLWRTQGRGDFVFDGLAATGNYDQSKGNHQAIVRTSYWGMSWEPIGGSDALSPSDELPQSTSYVWETYVDDTFRIARETCANAGDYLIHWNNSENYSGARIANGVITEMPYGGDWQIGADGKYHSGQWAGFTCWTEDGKLYWEGVPSVISMLDAYDTGSEKEGSTGGTVVIPDEEGTVRATSGGTYQALDNNWVPLVHSESGVVNIWKGTAAEYGALASYDNNTFYIIL